MGDCALCIKEHKDSFKKEFNIVYTILTVIYGFALLLIRLYLYSLLKYAKERIAPISVMKDIPLATLGIMGRTDSDLKNWSLLAKNILFFLI